MLHRKRRAFLPSYCSYECTFLTTVDYVPGTRTSEFNRGIYSYSTVLGGGSKNAARIYHHCTGDWVPTHPAARERDPVSTDTAKGGNPSFQTALRAGHFLIDHTSLLRKPGKSGYTFYCLAAINWTRELHDRLSSPKKPPNDGQPLHGGSVPISCEHGTYYFHEHHQGFVFERSM